MFLLSIFLVLLAVPLVSMPPLVTCHIGQRVHTSANNINICEDCPSGTFMNLSSHSLIQCFNCSECPAGRFIGRECNLTCNTVCCPMEDMTVIDTEAGQFCAISADEFLENYTATCENNTGQISNNGAVQNRSETVLVCKADTYDVRRFGYILAIAMIVVFILVPKSQHTRTWRELVCVIVAIVAVCPIVFVREDNVGDGFFLACMILFGIYCLYTLWPILFRCIKKLRNIASILWRQQTAPDTLPHESYPLINDSNNRRSQPAQSCQDAVSSSTGDSLPDEPASNNRYTSNSAEVGDDPNDTSLHTEAGGCRPASHRVVAPEPSNQTSASGDSCSDKAGESGRSRGAGADDDGNTELSHDALGLNFRTESKSKEIEAGNENDSG